MGVEVREDGHDCGPDQSTVVVRRGLCERSQPYGRGELSEVTHVELDVRGAPIKLIWVPGFLETRV